MEAERMAVARLPPLQMQVPRRTVPDISPRNRRKMEGLTGPSYTLKGVKHPLPPPSTLKPFCDTSSGVLDTWPAHSQNQMMSNVSVGLTKDKALVLYNDEEAGKQNTVPKPRFLEQLEKYLKKELRALGVEEMEPSELRLQAHREVFEYLIEDFKTYKPLLAAVKNEYEMMLAHQRQQIRRMEPLRQMLVTVSDQCDQKIMAIREDERKEIADLKAENSGLYRKMDEIRNDQRSLEAQVERLQEELADMYKKYLDQADSNKELLRDINELRYQQEDMMVLQTGDGDIEEEEPEDPVFLRIALKKAREDLTDVLGKLHKMEADYGDVIPRREFEMLEAKHKTLNEEHETTHADYEKLQMEHEALLDVHKKLEEQRNEYFTEVETMKRTATPRPYWDKFAEVVEGGAEKWDQMVENKTSREVADLLLEQIAAGGTLGGGEGDQVFQAHGTDASVAPYLRYEGQVRNRRLGKRDLLIYVKDIWNQKGMKDTERETGAPRTGMPEFMADYLKRQYALPHMAAEWAYNLHDAASRFTSDPQVAFFYDVLIGEADEEQRHALLGQVAALYKKLEEVAEERPAITKDEMNTVLSEMLPQKPELSRKLLCQRAEEELEAREEETTLQFKSLFTEDDEGSSGPFLKELRKQYAEEREDLVVELEEAMGDATEISPEVLEKALKGADPEAPEAATNAMLGWVFRPGAEKTLSDCTPLDRELVLKRLRGGDTRRRGARPESS